jgi:hypothetical protein
VSRIGIKLTLVLLLLCISTGCALSVDPIKTYCIGWTGKGDAIKSIELVNSAIEMMKSSPNKSVFGGEGFLYKDWVEFHELMISGDITLDERKQISKLLSNFCSELK